MTFNRIGVVKALSMLSFSFLMSTGASQATVFEFATSDSQFDPGVNNQGWYSTGFPSLDSSDNYFVGLSGGTEFRNFFTFDLSGLSEDIVSARLVLDRYIVAADPAGETLTIYDVSRDAADLNQNGFSPDIFADLGTGVVYGSADFFPTGTPDPFQIVLTVDAIAAINAARGGFFSVGGRLTTLEHSGNQFIFGTSDGTVGGQRLIVSTESIPEPMTATLFGTGMLGLAFVRRHGRRTARRQAGCR